MNWRTSKPTADKILAVLKNGIWVVLNHRKIGQSYGGISYEEEYADEYGNEYATGFIDKWADLEEDEGAICPQKGITTEDAMAKLDEHIKAAGKSWKGVDVDKFMAEIREEDETVTDCNELEEEVKKYINDNWECEHSNENAPLYLYDFSDKDLLDAACHFAKWGAEHLKK